MWPHGQPRAGEPFPAGHRRPLEIKATTAHPLFLVSTASPSSLLPSFWPTRPEFPVECRTRAELSGPSRALCLWEFSLQEVKHTSPNQGEEYCEWETDMCPGH